MTPHHPAADRLFTEGCCLCGCEHAMTSVGVNGGTCGPCFAKHDCDFMKLDAEIRRRSLTTPPAPASEKFKPGDRVRAIRSGPSIAVGEVGTVLERRYPLQNENETRVSFDVRPNNVYYHPTENLEAASAQRIETEKLCTCCHRTKATREDMSNNPLCSLCYDTGHIGGRPSTHVDCCHVKSTPSANPPEAPIAKPERVEVAAPYKRTDGLTDSQIAALVAAADAVPGKRAAKRARHVSECLASLESDGKKRAEAVRHASDWDVDDAPSNYSTHGSGR